MYDTLIVKIFTKLILTAAQMTVKSIPTLKYDFEVYASMYEKTNSTSLNGLI